MNAMSNECYVILTFPEDASSHHLGKISGSNEKETPVNVYQVGSSSETPLPKDDAGTCTLRGFAK